MFIVYSQVLIPNLFYHIYSMYSLNRLYNPFLTCILHDQTSYLFPNMSTL